MKKKIAAMFITLLISIAPVTSSYSQQGSTAAGGISPGTAIAIGVVGAALLVALGDSSSSAPAAVAASVSGATEATSTTTVSSQTQTTVSTATTTTTN